MNQLLEAHMFGFGTGIHGLWGNFPTIINIIIDGFTHEIFPKMIWPSSSLFPRVVRSVLRLNGVWISPSNRAQIPNLSSICGISFWLPFLQDMFDLVLAA